ncbi:MAG: hypothetical protein GY859_20730 [Desulfobacterales bacterium]|nr:hypothetical protein [Desulfobacterales bacterium]
MDDRDRIIKRVGDLIDDLISRNKLSNVRLAEIMACTPNTIDKYRRMKNLPRTMFINKLRRLFGVRMKWLYHGKGKRYHGNGLGPLKQPHDPWSEAPDPVAPFDSRDDASAPGSTAAISDEAGAGPPWYERIPEILTRLAWILELKNSYSLTIAANVDLLYRVHLLAQTKEALEKDLKQARDDRARLAARVGSLYENPAK